MLVDPLSNFYLYYSLEKNDGTAVSERVQVSEACWHSSGVAPTEFKRMKTVN